MMNNAHLHLLVTHLPVLGSLFGLVLLLLGLIRGSHELKRTAFWVFLAAAVIAVPTYLTGSPANAVLMRAMPGMSTDRSDQHAEVAVVALVAISALGVAGLAALIVSRKGKLLPIWLSLSVLVLAFLTTALMVWTASLGGQIRHTEIQPGVPISGGH